MGTTTKPKLSHPYPNTKRSGVGIHELVCVLVGIVVALAPLDFTHVFCMAAGAASFLLCWLLQPGLQKTCHDRKSEEGTTDETCNGPTASRNGSSTRVHGEASEKALAGLAAYSRVAAALASAIAKAAEEEDEEESAVQSPVVSRPASSPRSSELRQRAQAFLEESLDSTPPKAKKEIRTPALALKEEELNDSVTKVAVLTMETAETDEGLVDCAVPEVSEEAAIQPTASETSAKILDSREHTVDDCIEPAVRLSGMQQMQFQDDTEIDKANVPIIRPPPGLAQASLGLPTRTPAQRELLKLEKKLRDIQKLQHRALAGEKLERNQFEKIATVTHIQRQIAELQAHEHEMSLTEAVLEKAEVEEVPTKKPQGSEESRISCTPRFEVDTCTKLNAHAAPFNAVLAALQPARALEHEQACKLIAREDSCWSWAQTGFCPRGRACVWKHPPLHHFRCGVATA